MFTPPYPKFKPSWKARKVKAPPIAPVVKKGSSAVIFVKVDSGLTKRTPDACPVCGGSGIEEAGENYVRYCPTCDGWGISKRSGGG